MLRTGFRSLFLTLSCLLAAFSIPLAAHEKRIAISFDDAPRGAGAFLEPGERTRLLIEGLERSGVEQAAFFVNPGRIANQPGSVARIAAYVAAGHVIANHTFDHPRLSRTPLSDYLRNLDRAAAWLDGREGYRPWFRYPFLDEGRSDAEKRDGMRAALAQRGLINAYVTVEASDWFYEGAAMDAAREGKAIDRDALRDLYVRTHVEAAEFYDALAVQAIGRSPAHVLLLHENDIAGLWIADLIGALKAKGWTIITNDEAYQDPFGAYSASYETPSAGGTLTEQVAWELGLPSPRWYEGNDVALARQWFQRLVLGEEEETP